MASNTPVANYDKLVETESYRKSREVINNDVNYFIHARKIGGTVYAPFTIADLGRVHQTNYNEFKKTQLEKESLKNIKSLWREDQKAKFGSEWTKKSASKSKYLELHVKI